MISTKRAPLDRAAMWAVSAAFGLCAGAAMAQPANAPMIGAIQNLSLGIPGDPADDVNDPYRGGVITVAGQDIIIPRNLLIDLPANRLTLEQLFLQAPLDCRVLGVSGLAASDALCEGGAVGVATVLANVTPDGRVVAGDLFIEKGQELLAGIVREVNYGQGYLIVGVDPASPGTMVRFNDPLARHSIQRGAGCRPGSGRGDSDGDGSEDNCSPDVRFTEDPDNYTHTFTTGYPACIPSRRRLSQDPSDPRLARRDPSVTPDFTPANANGRNDTFCPHTNRVDGAPVRDSTKFAPIQPGDHITAEGNMETIRGATFLSTHTLTVHRGLTTKLSWPDFLIFDEAEWDTAGFQNERVRSLFIGFGTLSGANGDVEVWRLDVDPHTGENKENILATTRGCDAADGIGSCTQQGLGLNAGFIWKLRYDVDFIVGVAPTNSPCLHLNSAVLNGQVLSPAFCRDGRGLNDEAAIMIPMTREVIARSRNKSENRVPNGRAHVEDVTGRDAPWGEYLTPVGIGHPEFVEINLDAVATPFIFEGQTWNLDRRTSPNGCEEGVDCSADINVALDPFPVSCLDPAGEVNFLPGMGLLAFRNLITTPLAPGSPGFPANAPLMTTRTLCP